MANFFRFRKNITWVIDSLLFWNIWSVWHKKIKRSYLNCKIILINCSMLTKMFVQLDKQGFWKCDMAREWKMRHKNSEKSEDQGTNTAPRWASWNWIQASFIRLSALNERICRELNYHSCGLQGKEQKWSLTIE